MVFLAALREGFTMSSVSHAHHIARKTPSVLPCQVVESVDDAEFLLAHGAECLGRPGNEEPREASLDEIRAVLEAGAEKGLPLLVANPDIVTVSGPDLIVMPGTFGRWYKEMGGQVCAPHWCKGGKGFHQQPVCWGSRCLG